MAEAADRLVGTSTTAVALFVPLTSVANRPSQTANHLQYTKEGHEGRVRGGLAVADVMPDLQSCHSHVSCQLVCFMISVSKDTFRHAVVSCRSHVAGARALARIVSRLLMLLEGQNAQLLRLLYAVMQHRHLRTVSQPQALPVVTFLAVNL